MNAPTDWVSAIAILSAGLILGLLFVVFFNRKKAAKKLGGEKDLQYKDLTAKRDALVQQLRDLDENASPAERQRLELATAEVLRQLDDRRGGDVVIEPARDAAPASTMNPALKGFLWGAGSFAALAALGYMVMQAANPRQDGGSVTGGDPAAQMQAAPAPDPAIQQLEAAVQSDPDNLKLRNDLAQAWLERDNLMAVFEQTKFVLEKAPDDSRALTYQGLVRLAMGEGELAGKMLEHATKSDPKNLDSWVARAWLYAQGGDMKKAEAMIAEAGKQSPEDKPRLEQVFKQMQQQVAEAKNAPVQAAQANELPPGHPAIDGSAPVQAAAPAAGMQTRPAPPADGRSVKVTLSLDAGAKQKSGILYVMARSGAGGPPVAVKRLQVNAFPITFDFGSTDSMMGQPLPDSFRLEARLDSDGDAATKPPTDPSAVQMNVAPGAQVKLALK